MAELARLQVGGLFYWITFDAEGGKGGFWPGRFVLLGHAAHADWGNARQIGFMQMVHSWEPRVLVDTAGGFFKVAIRKHPEHSACWSWALEWNQNYRLIGFFGDPASGDTQNRPVVDT